MVNEINNTFPFGAHDDLCDCDKCGGADPRIFDLIQSKMRNKDVVGRVIVLPIGPSGSDWVREMFLSNNDDGV